MRAPGVVVNVYERASSVITGLRARRAIARMVPFDALADRARDRIVRSRRRVLEGSVILHRSPTATPEVEELRTEDLHMTVLEDVLVDVYHGFAVTRSGSILRDTVVTPSAVERKLHNGKLLRPTRTMTMDRPVMNLECGPKNSNFFHFWFESLTKLLWIDEPEVTALGPSYLLHSRELAPWQETLLREALPAHVTTLRIGRGTRVVAPLYVDLPAYRGTALDPGSVRTLRGWTAALVPPSAGAEHPRRLAITRRAAAKRRLTNQAALDDALTRRGFTVVALEDLMVEEQIRHFRAADVIVAQHGAGLTHLLHARPGTRLLEILPSRPGDGLLHYRGISATVGIDYSNLYCGSPERDADAPAPLDEVLSWVDRIDASGIAPSDGGPDGPGAG